MASSVKSNFKAVMAKIERAVKQTATKDQMEQLGEKAVEYIQVRTRLGYGVARQGASREKLVPLKDKTIERRAARDDLSDLTRPGRSNLTMTGQLLDSLVVDASEGRAIIEPSGGRYDSDSTNQDVADGVSKKRPFLSLSDLEIKKLIRYFEKDILKKTIRRVVR